MKKITIIIGILFVVLLFLQISACAQQNLETTEHEININTANSEIKIKETLIVRALDNNTLEEIQFWIQDINKAKNINIVINRNNTEYESIDNNILACNISKFDFSNESDPLTIVLTYNMPKQTEIFEKKILNSVSKDISLQINDKEIFISNSMSYNNHFQIRLYEPSETPITWYMTGFIILLVVLLGVVSIYSLKNHKTKKSNEILSGSKELYFTQKKLLTQLLKELEKQHRDSKISDDTYHKIKGRYKQEAVNTMKKLDDIEASKIK